LGHTKDFKIVSTASLT